jgi:hypothetical protein
MSAAYFIVLDNDDPGFDTAVNGKFLSQDATKIAKIAKLVGVPTLDDFVSYSPEEAQEMMEDFGTDPEEVEGIELPEQKWFTPQQGLDFVAKVTAHIKDNPKAVKNVKGVLSDLEQYQQVFSQTKRVGASWCLQIDF